MFRLSESLSWSDCGQRIDLNCQQLTITNLKMIFLKNICKEELGRTNFLCPYLMHLCIIVEKSSNKHKYLGINFVIKGPTFIDSNRCNCSNKE